MKKISILFVCMGNICRSPTAEGVFRRFVDQTDMTETIRIDSAGTHAYHAGSSPDPRAQRTAGERGYDLSDLIGRQVSAKDFERFDYILAMDKDNLVDLLLRCPLEHKHKLALFLSYSSRYKDQEVPDPYYGGPQGFQQVLDMVEDGAIGLLEAIRGRSP